MKISKSVVEKFLITGIENLDPIAVMVEDFGPGAGKITITRCGDAWSHYWSHMGETNKLADFFCGCDEHYLAHKLKTGIKNTVTTEEGLEAHLKRHIIERRREDAITRDFARLLWDAAGQADLSDHDLFYNIFGDEWWYCLPEEPNPEYVDLCRIIKTVQAAFKQLKEKPCE